MTTSRSTSASMRSAVHRCDRVLCWRPAVAATAQPGAAAFDSSKAWEHLRQQVAIGPRPSGSPANVKNRDYIKAQMAALGIKTIEQPFDGATPLGPVKMVNMIATIPGQRPDRIVLASHFDTKLFRDVALRRRQRRRLEHRGADRAGARASRRAASCRSRSSCCSSTAKKRSSSGRAPTTPTAAATTSRRRASPAR